MSGALSYRYPGAHHFDESAPARRLFFGREEDTDALLYKVLAEDFVIVFGSSGHGKSSLIRAGLIPPLRDRAYLPVVARLPEGPDPAASIRIAVKAEAERHGVEWTVGSEASLWHFFKTLQLTDSEGRTLTPVLVLDQFEELFTSVDDPTIRRAFVEDFADLIRGTRPEHVEADSELEVEAGPARLKVLISIRGDYLFELESLPRSIPQVFHARFRVRPLRRGQAKDAIRLPARDPGDGWATEPFEWEDDAIEELLNFLCRLEGESDRRAHVNPFVMQLVCRYAERNVHHALASPIAEGWMTALTTGSDDDQIEGLERVLVEYYEGCVATAATVDGQVDEERMLRLRELCEERLISEDGHRLTLDAGTAGRLVPSPSDLEHLEDERLLNSYVRGKVRYYELSHDGLVRAVYLARERARQRRELELRAALKRQRRRIGGAVAAAVAALYLLMADDWRDGQLIGAARDLLDGDGNAVVAAALLSEATHHSEAWERQALRALYGAPYYYSSERSDNAATAFAIASDGRAVVGTGRGFARLAIGQSEVPPAVVEDRADLPGAVALRSAQATGSWIVLGFDLGGVVAVRGAESIVPVGRHLDSFGSGVAVRGVDVSSDGRYVASGDEQAMLRLTDRSPGATPIPPVQARGIVWTLALHPTIPRLLASATRDGWVTLWDGTGGELRPTRTLNGGGGGGVNVSLLQFAGEHRDRLVVVRRAGPSWLVRLNGNTLGDSVEIGTIRHASLSPNGKHLVTMTQEGDVTIREVDRPETVVATVRHAGGGNAQWMQLLDEPDGVQPFRLATGRSDGSVLLWEAARRGERGILSGRFVRLEDHDISGGSSGVLFREAESEGGHSLIMLGPVGSDVVVQAYDLAVYAPFLPADTLSAETDRRGRMKQSVYALSGSKCLPDVRDDVAGFGLWFGFLNFRVWAGRRFSSSDLDVCDPSPRRSADS